MGESNSTERWLEIEVCLMNAEEKERKVAGALTADKVSMVKMSIKVDTGCRDLALPESLVKRLNLKHSSNVDVSSSTDVNVPIGRYGPVLVFWIQLYWAFLCLRR